MLHKSLAEINDLPESELLLWYAYMDLKREKQ